MRNLLALCLFAFVLVPFRAEAASVAVAPHVSVALISKDSALKEGHDTQLGLHFVLEKGWHVYWSNPGDSGEPPRVRWTLPAGNESALRIDELRWPTPHRLAAGPLVNYGYEDEVVLPALLYVGSAVTGLGKGALPIIADVTWLVCSEDACIPGKAQLSLSLPLRTVAAADPEASPKVRDLFTTTTSALPVVPPSSWQLSGTLDASTFHVRADLAMPAESLHVSFLPLDADQIENAAPQEISAAGSILTLRLRRSEQLLKDVALLRGVLVLEAAAQPTRSFVVAIPITPSAPAIAAPTVEKPPAVSTPVPSAPTTKLPLWLALVFAVLGGALLNLMPCVFPVLSIKALGLLQMSATDRGVARRHALAYTAGILVSFWVLAGLLIALRYTGQQIGWGFHLQSPRFLFGLSALLFFLGLNLLGVFELGIGLTQIGQVTVGQHGYAGAFATGVLATVVATPCTAPFMGTAVGFALSQAAPAALLIFTCLGLGLALPYLLLPWIPGLLRMLPRPGAWMETFKHAMGFLLFATVLWLAWVLGAQGGADAVVALLGGLLVVGIAGWVLHRWAGRGVATVAAATLVLLGALLPGWGISAAPPSVNPVSGQKISSDDLPWEPFTPERLAAYRRAGKPVFLDFTAEWCVSCKVNERLVLRSQEVRARIQELGVVAMKADWTNQDPAITQALKAFGRSGIPFYVLYARDTNTPPIELSAVISTASVLRALDQVK